ncbi:hypothetical protein GCM10022221_37880 [Actinocorallia aurea]
MSALIEVIPAICHQAVTDQETFIERLTTGLACKRAIETPDQLKDPRC